MAPTVSIKTFVLSTRWGLPGPATSSSAPPPVVQTSGKLWTCDVRTQITWVV